MAALTHRMKQLERLARVAKGLPDVILRDIRDVEQDPTSDELVIYCEGHRTTVNNRLIASETSAEGVVQVLRSAVNTSAAKRAVAMGFVR